MSQHGTGNYTGYLTAAAAGSYQVQLLQLPGGFQRSQAALLSFNLTIAPAAVDPYSSLVSGGGLTRATVDQPSYFTVTFSLGNPELIIREMLCHIVHSMVAFLFKGVELLSIVSKHLV